MLKKIYVSSHRYIIVNCQHEPGDLLLDLAFGPEKKGLLSASLYLYDDLVLGSDHHVGRAGVREEQSESVEVCEVANGLLTFN